jgi:acetyl-CoA carboxylase carboxyl transferase subunit beta
VAWLFGGKKDRKVVITQGLWIKCEACREIVYRPDVEKNARTCPRCGAPFRLSARDRLTLLLDPDSFEERDAGLRSLDPLGFKDGRGRYRDRLAASREKTGGEDAVLSGLGRIGGYPVVICVFEFAFMGGSMASVVGEKITRAIELAARKRTPLLIVTCSGGARMQEGVLALMQLPRTTVAVDAFRDVKLPYIVVLTHPTTGGVTASYAMLGDVHLAEPGALIGFAGPRVIEQTIREKLPEGFQKAEYLLEHGMVDMVVHRHQLRPTIARLCRLLGAEAGPEGPPEPPAIEAEPV